MCVKIVRLSLAEAINILLLISTFFLVVAVVLGHPVDCVENRRFVYFSLQHLLDCRSLETWKLSSSKNSEESLPAPALDVG